MIGFTNVALSGLRRRTIHKRPRPAEVLVICRRPR
jgi:hypothetical protein